MTPEAMHNSLQGWWQMYARTLTDTADYEPWLPRETILDQFATLVHSLASHETQWNWQTHRCSRYEVNPHGLTRERVRAVLSVWWHTHRTALVESTVDVHSAGREGLFAALVVRLVEIANEAIPLRPEEQQAARRRTQVLLSSFDHFPWLSVSVPPMLEEALGYTGDQHMVSFCSTPDRRLRWYDGWGGQSHFGSWRVWQAFHAHPYVRARVPGYASHLLGLDAPESIVYCLVLHRQRRQLEAQEIWKADREIYQRNCSFAMPPLPVDPALVTQSEEMRLAALRYWLDERQRSIQAHPYVFVCSPEIHRRWQESAQATYVPLPVLAWQVPPPSVHEPTRPLAVAPHEIPDTLPLAPSSAPSDSSPAALRRRGRVRRPKHDPEGHHQ